MVDYSNEFSRFIDIWSIGKVEMVQNIISIGNIDQLWCNYNELDGDELRAL